MAGGDVEVVVVAINREEGDIIREGGEVRKTSEVSQVGMRVTHAKLQARLGGVNGVVRYRESKHLEDGLGIREADQKPTGVKVLHAGVMLRLRGADADQGAVDEAEDPLTILGAEHQRERRQAVGKLGRVAGNKVEAWDLGGRRIVTEAEAVDNSDVGGGNDRTGTQGNGVGVGRDSIDRGTGRTGAGDRGGAAGGIRGGAGAATDDDEGAAMTEGGVPGGIGRLRGGGREWCPRIRGRGGGRRERDTVKGRKGGAVEGSHSGGNT